MDYFEVFISILGSAIRLSIPLLFTALAGLFSERAGIFDIGLEGKMLVSAFASACVAYYTGNAWAGLGAGIVTAILNPTQARTFLGIGFAVPIENAAAAAGMPPF